MCPDNIKEFPMYNMNVYSDANRPPEGKKRQLKLEIGARMESFTTTGHVLDVYVWTFQTVKV